MKSWCSKNRLVKNVRTIYNAPSTAEFSILKTLEIFVSEIEKNRQIPYTYYLHSTTETATMPRNSQAHRTEIRRPGGSRPGPNLDNISLED